MDVSIVIPTLNEENYLPRLLTSIKNQTLQPKEIIVADADSTDKTREIAKSFGCVVTKGGYLPTGRNNGAKIAKSEMLLFLDADVVLPADFLKKNLEEFNKRHLDLASPFITIKEGNFFDKFGAQTINTWYWYSQSLTAHAHGSCIFVKHSLHDHIHGFDEKVFVGEDLDYALRARKVGKCGILASCPLIFSLRRFKEKGRIRTSLTYLYIELYMTLFGPIRKRIFTFDYGKH